MTCDHRARWLRLAAGFSGLAALAAFTGCFSAECGTPTIGGGSTDLGGGGGGAPALDAHGLAEFISRMQPGDSLLVPAGTYVVTGPDDVFRPPSGTAAAPITIRGELSGRQGQRPIISGGNNLAALIRLQGVSYVHLSNLELTHDPSAVSEAAYCRDGILVDTGLCRGIEFTNLYIHDLDEYGMSIQDVDDLTITNSRIEYCGFGALGGPVGAAGGWRNVVVRDCRLSHSGRYYQGAYGSTPHSPRPAGLATEPSQGPLLIENTTLEHNLGDGLESQCLHTTIHNCVVANNLRDGVKLSGDDSTVVNTVIFGDGGESGPTPWCPVVIYTPAAQSRFSLINCTVERSIAGSYLMRVQHDTPDVPLRVTLLNTIFSSLADNTPIFVGRATTLVGTNNLFHLPQTDPFLEHGPTGINAANLATLGAGNRTGDPLFLARGDNYHVAADSPAVDHGTAAGAPSADLDGTSRPRGGGVDIGAYER
ncbi:MAG: right-handed parallel beta-helix repeat-containing protein [Armatimonadetes bacterium]|nr:right-handed parallel beta-helix repeat-containing protein [Armatimonadota bacterium]